MTGFRGKLLASYLLLVAAVELITILVLNQSLAADLEKRLDDRLAQQARGAAIWVEARRELHGERSEYSSSDRQAIRLAGVVRAWVTIIDRKGQVVGDSERRSGVDLPYTEEEATQPEVLTARGGEVGRATRISKRHGEMMHLVAVPGEEGYVVRLGVPLSEVTSTITAMRTRLVAASLVAFVVAAVLGLFAARQIARPVKAMTSTAARIARGDYDIPAPAQTPDELGVLANALATLAAQLKARIGELTHERDRLSAILEGMVEGVVVIDPQERIVVINRSAAELLGHAPESLVGTQLADPELAPLLLKTMARGEQLQVELASVRSLIVSAQPLEEAAGGGLVAVIHDVTQLRRLEEMRREFVANVSHELRTPVAAIQGYAETLLRGVDDKTRAEFLEVIHRHSRRIGRLVGDLLHLAEIEARAPEKAVREVVHIADVLAAVEDTARERLHERGARIVRELEDGVAVSGDPDGLEQVLTNLVDNAIKYGREGGTITVSAHRDKERVVLVVADDGPGIAPEHLPRIFERFYRVDVPRSRDLGGTGLGLAIVRRLVESMNGTISAESTAGAGARFIVVLPGASMAVSRRTSIARA